MIQSLLKANIYDNDPVRYQELEPDKQQALLRWIASNIEPKRNKHSSAYTLKHFFESAADGFYVTSGEFAGALLAAGYRMRKLEEQWENRRFYCVLKKSVR